MQRRNFLKAGALTSSALLFSRKLGFAATESGDAVIEVMLDEPLGTISPLIYSHFTEGFDTPDFKEARSLLDELA